MAPMLCWQLCKFEIGGTEVRFASRMFGLYARPAKMVYDHRSKAGVVFFE